MNLPLYRNTLRVGLLGFGVVGSGTHAVLTDNRATIAARAGCAIDQVIPFIELPDMLVTNPLKLNEHSLGAINLAARMGITGVPVAVPQDPQRRALLQESLAKMKLVMSDGTGLTLGEALGSDLMDHPLNAALWLVRELNRQGIRVQPGQFLSLGTFPPVRPPKAGTRFIVNYKGLEGSEPVWVQFRE